MTEFLKRYPWATTILPMIGAALIAGFGTNAVNTNNADNGAITAPHSPCPPTPNCQCGCTVTGQCVCKDCDHPALEKPKTKAKAENVEPGKN